MTPSSNRDKVQKSRINGLSCFVICSYDDDWWIGIIRETSFEFQGILIKFINWLQTEELYKSEIIYIMRYSLISE